MPRPVTLFTGQWADMPLEKLAPLVATMGYDGVELACWGDHFEVDKALSSKGYLRDKWELLQANGLSCNAISNHLVGQAVCDLIDERHRLILPPDVWGDGKPEGVRRRAAKKLIATAKAARRFFDARRASWRRSSTASPDPRSGTRSTASPPPRRSSGTMASRILAAASGRSWTPSTPATSTSGSRSIRPRSRSTSRARVARSAPSRGTAASASTTTRRTSGTRASTT